ncbi:hypothetical protein [Mycobacterium colombiense]|uniref:hypothetical protein n=1 Tax=Mycobacterium colombiense TaxID=339268 RepID=UPI000A936BF5|nr:hypothetical protein [Mycobacterium colombiense]
MTFRIGDLVRQSSHLGAVTDIGGLVPVTATEGALRMVCPRELERYTPHWRAPAPGSIRSEIARQAMMAVHRVQEPKLAWALIEAAKLSMSLDERNFVFVTIGAGDTFAAVRHVLKIIADKGIPLDPQLAQWCITWLDTYACHDEHENLCGLVENCLAPPNTAQAPGHTNRSPVAARSIEPLRGAAHKLRADRMRNVESRMH